MALKTIVSIPFVSINLTEEGTTGRCSPYALSLASSQMAHLSVVIAAMRLTAPSAFIPTARSLIHSANDQVQESAAAIAKHSMDSFSTHGVIGDAGVIFDEFQYLCEQAIRHVRTADVAIMHPQNKVLSLQQGLLEAVLFESGRPVIVEPDDWNADASPRRVLVSWDGTAKAARAVGDALPLLQQATEVEILSVSGDTKHKDLDGSDIARHLSRHCAKVSITQLPAPDGKVEEVISNHASYSRADLLVMGAYGHSHLQQMVWGGVTTAMIHKPPVPIFMSF